MERISSRRNPLVAEFRRASALEEDRLLLDGAHLVEEALRSGVQVELVAVADRLPAEASRALTRLADSQGARVIRVTESVLDAISPVRQPSGVVAMARRPLVDLTTALAGPAQLVLLLHEVQDPGNVGAIVRVGEACGATAVVADERTASPFGWKALRGSMGSVFRLPVVARASLADALTAARSARLRIFAAMPSGGTPLFASDLRQPAAVVFGSEGGGLPDAIVAMAAERLTIPMRAPVESLNVATAAALVVYEAYRQRTAASHDHVALRRRSASDRG